MYFISILFFIFSCVLIVNSFVNYTIQLRATFNNVLPAGLLLHNHYLGIMTNLA